jgi:hypothetical protein
MRAKKKGLQLQVGNRTTKRKIILHKTNKLPVAHLEVAAVFFEIRTLQASIKD